MRYEENVVNELCRHLLDGDSQKVACKKVGLGKSTFYEWMHKWPDFKERIKKAKDEFRETIVCKLEASLWKRAMGYDAVETETEYVNDSNGNPWIKSQKKKVKHIQPDTGALIFALTNVAPEKWKNRQQIGNVGGSGDAICVEVSGDGAQVVKDAIAKIDGISVVSDESDK